MHTARVRETETHNSIVRRHDRRIEKKSVPRRNFPFDSKTGQNVYGHIHFIGCVRVPPHRRPDTHYISYTQCGVWLSVQLKRTKTSRVRNVCLVYLRTHASNKLPHARPTYSCAIAHIHTPRKPIAKFTLIIWWNGAHACVAWRTARQVRLSVGRFITI